MAQPGPKPKPRALKELAGNPGHRPLNTAQPRPEPKAPAMPRGVLPKSARKAWRELAPQLEALGLLSEIDAPLFTLLCVWTGAALDAAAVIRRDEEQGESEQGVITEDDRGRERKSRALSVLRAASVEIRQLAAEFGLSPSSRSRLEVPPSEEPSLAEMLFHMAVSEGEEGDNEPG